MSKKEMVSLDLDLALRNGSFKIYMALFNANSPQMFLIESPRTKLELSLVPEKRKPQLKQFLYGINPQGLVGTVELWKFYTSGMRINGKTFSGFDAIAHILSRTLAIQTEIVEKLISDAYEKGFAQIYFITKANANGCETTEKNEWLVLKAIPTTDERLIGLNKILSKVGSHFRAFTTKTYVEKTYGTD